MYKYFLFPQCDDIHIIYLAKCEEEGQPNNCGLKFTKSKQVHQAHFQDQYLHCNAACEYSINCEGAGEHLLVGTSQP